MPRIPFRLGAVVQPRSAHRAPSVFRLLVALFFLLSFASIAEGTGPLSVDRANPGYFIDSSGKPVYLTGAHLNNNLIDRSDKAVLDYSAYLDFLEQNGHNFIRLWAWEQSAWSHETTAKIQFDPSPHERSGQGTALDGDSKFDLSRFNQAYFDRLRSRVIEAGQRGIYVSVMLFQGFSSQKKRGKANPWPGHPFHAANNINGINGDLNGNGEGEEVHTLVNPAVVQLQEEYVRKVVETLNDLDSVLYEISGETPLRSIDWQYHMIDYLKAYQATKANQHPVGISYFYNGKGTEPFASTADWVLLLGTSASPALAAGDKVILLDMDAKLLRSKNARQWVWKSFMRGYNPIYQESERLNTNERVALSMGQAATYAQMMDLSALSPNDRVCSTGYCLVNPGFEYLVYAPSGGKLTVNLSGADGIFVISWYNPATGDMLFEGSVAGGKTLAFSTPWKGEAVLFLAAVSQEWGLSSIAPVSSVGISLSASATLSVIQESSVSTTITVGADSTNLPVTFSVSGLPKKATASFSQKSCQPACSTILTIKAAKSTPVGSTTITVKANTKNTEQTSTINLSVLAAGSKVATETASAPAISPYGGTFAGSVVVSLQTSTSGSSIYYTTDGMSPTQSSKQYTGPFTLSRTTLVKAKAFKEGGNPSPESSAWFTKEDGFDFNLAHSGNKSVTAGSSVTNSISVTLTSGSVQAASFSVSGLPSGASGSFSSAVCSPSCSSTLTITTSAATPAGSSAVTVTATGGGVTKTTTFSLTVTLPTTAVPTISPNGGTFTGSVSVTMQTATSGASIYYTTNGTTPTQGSTLYSDAITLSSSATIRAIAVKTGHNASSEVSATFSISPPPSQLTLTWHDHSDNEENFRIERKTGTSGTYAQIALLGANVTSYVNAGLVKGTAYCYRLQATNTAGASAYTNEACAVAP